MSTNFLFFLVDFSPVFFGSIQLLMHKNSSLLVRSGSMELCVLVCQRFCTEKARSEGTELGVRKSLWATVANLETC